MKPITNHQDDVTTYWVLRDSTTHAPKTSVTITDIDVYYVEEGAAIAAKADLTALAAADSAHADNKGYEIGQGVYRIDWPDAAFDGGVGKSVILIVVCSGVDTAYREIILSPSANAVAAGGTSLTAGDYGASIASILADTGTDGVVLAADAITSAKIADDAFSAEHFADDCIVAASLADDTLAAIQSECNDALIANNLDHLCLTATGGADMTTEVVDNTIISRIIGNGDTSTFVPSTDGLHAAGVDLDAILEDTSSTLDDLVDGLESELAKVPKSDSNVTWNATALGSIQSECTDALNAYDPPTDTEMDAAFAALSTSADIADAVWDEASTGHTDTGKAGAQVWTDIDAILEDTGTTLPATEFSANVTKINSVATTSVSTINANLGTTQPINFTGTAGSALAKADIVDVAGAAVSTSTAQIGVNAVQIGAAVPGSATIGTVTAVTNDVGITQAGADKVWGTAARALTDKAGFALADSTSDAVIADAVWNAATATYGTTGTYGEKVEGLNTGSVTIADSSSDAVIADAVWNAATATYGTSGTYGETVEAILTDTNEIQGDTHTAAESATAVWGAETRVLTAIDEDTTTLDINTAVENAVSTVLNTAIPGSPTSDSINERIKALDDHVTADYGSTEKTAIDLLDDTDGGLADIHTTCNSILEDTGTTLPAQITALTEGGVKKNTELAGFTFYMVDSSDHVTAKTGLTITATRSIDGAAFASCANSAAEISGGWYKITLAAADLNGDVIALRFTASGADETGFTIKTSS